MCYLDKNKNRRQQHNMCERAHAHLCCVRLCNVFDHRVHRFVYKRNYIRTEGQRLSNERVL